MPKLELGDLEAVAQRKDVNVPELARLGRRGLGHRRAGSVLRADVQAGAAAACSRTIREVLKVARAMFDPFEYLMLRHRAGKLRTDFSTALGKVAYHVPCHLRVQNIGLKTRDVLRAGARTRQVEPIERCSGHDGTYGVKKRVPRRSR